MNRAIFSVLGSMIDLAQGHSMLDVAPDARSRRLMLPVLGSSGLGDRLPLNCGCTLVVTTNPKIQGIAWRFLHFPTRGPPKPPTQYAPHFRLTLSPQLRH